MSARDKIHARLFKGPNENRDDLIDEFRDEVLREAAEKAREFGGPRSYPGESEANVRFMAGWHAATDYIEREATTSD